MQELTCIVMNAIFKKESFVLQAVSALQHPPPVPSAPSPAIPDTHPLAPVTPVPPVPSADPVVRKQAVQDLMAQMQGPYNFMQVRGCP